MMQMYDFLHLITNRVPKRERNGCSRFPRPLDSCIYFAIQVELFFVDIASN